MYIIYKTQLNKIRINYKKYIIKIILIIIQFPYSNHYYYSIIVHTTIQIRIIY